jgi:hypothetical protein
MRLLNQDYRPCVSKDSVSSPSPNYCPEKFSNYTCEKYLKDKIHYSKKINKYEYRCKKCYTEKNMVQKLANPILLILMRGTVSEQCCVAVIIRIVDGSLFLLVDDLFCSVVSTTIFVVGIINCTTYYGIVINYYVHY